MGAERPDFRPMVRRLTELRGQLGLSTEDVAERSGMQPGKVRKFEQLVHEPKLSTVLAYARAIGVRIKVEVPQLEERRPGGPS